MAMGFAHATSSGLQSCRDGAVFSSDLGNNNSVASVVCTRERIESLLLGFHVLRPKCFHVPRSKCPQAFMP